MNWKALRECYWKLWSECHLKVHLPQNSGIHLPRLVFSEAAWLSWTECSTSNIPITIHSCSRKCHRELDVLGEKNALGNKNKRLNSNKKRERTEVKKHGYLNPRDNYTWMNVIRLFTKATHECEIYFQKDLHLLLLKSKGEKRAVQDGGAGGR